MAAIVHAESDTAAASTSEGHGPPGLGDGGPAHDLRGKGGAARPATPSATWKALGSTVVLRTGYPWELRPAAEIVQRSLAAIDQACSRFRRDSDLSRVNAAAGHWVPVGPLLLDAIAVALRAAQLTDGLVDPTLGADLERAGYDRDWELMRMPRQLDAGRLVVRARRRGSWREVGVDRTRGCARAPLATKLDLGATAKAHAADLACAAVARELGCAALVALGGDVAIAGAAGEPGWEIHVTDDHRAGPGAPGQRVWIASGGLATSSTVARAWSVAGRRAHHIVDPRDGEPARSPWRTVSVAAGDCTDANIASTAALLLGEAAPRWLDERGLPARLVGHDGEVRTVGGWPAGASESVEVAA